MASLPRVLTVDSTWTLSRVVRAAVDLTDRPAIQVDVPGSAEALDEIQRGGYTVMVTALHIDPVMKGFELALRVKQQSPDTTVIILADVDDLEELDDETRAESPFIYLRRPVDIHQFMRVLIAALNGDDVFEAYHTPTAVVGTAAALSELGPVPSLDLKAAQKVMDKLLSELGAQAVLLSTREGDLLTERGATSGLYRDYLSAALMPSMQTTIAIGELVGGQASSVQFYDGEIYDVFALSVGFHHMLSIVFDGKDGARQFGAVTRFGRRAAEDLKALLGASAFIVARPESAHEAPTTRRGRPKVAPEPELEVEPMLVKAEHWVSDNEPKPSESQMPQLEPIENLDLSIFDALDKLTSDAADDLFDMEKLEEMASDSRRTRGSLTYDEAIELGIVP